MFYQDDTSPNIEGENLSLKAIYILGPAALPDGHVAGEHQGQWAAYLMKRWLK